MTYEVEPIGWIRSTRTVAEDDRWDQETASIELDPSRFTSEALLGLDTFSHVEVIYLMHHVAEAKIERVARHPRGESRWPRVGIFSQRAKSRPNRLGLTICRILSVAGLRVDVAGLDAIDGTPVLDLKPWYTAYGPRGPSREPAWVAELMARYW